MPMKLLVENGDVKLCYDASAVNRFKVFKMVPIGMSGDCSFSQMIALSSVFSKTLKSYFTKSQVKTALAKVHALKYTSRKFKT